MIMASKPTRLHLRGDAIVRRCETFKVGYTTRAEALDGCEDAMLAGRVERGCHLMPYACDRCNAWHIRNVRIVPGPPADVARADRRRGRAPWR